MAKLPPLSADDRENLSAYLDGELDTKAARALEARLNLDAGARAEAEALRRTWELLEYLPRPEPSATFTSRTLERVSALRPASAMAARRWRPWAFGIGWAAAVFLAGTVGYTSVSVVTKHNQPAVLPSEPVDVDQHLVRDLRVIENQHLYEHVDDIEFLRELAKEPELFGDGG